MKEVYSYQEVKTEIDQGERVACTLHEEEAANGHHHD
jgi:hypothetical protein